MLVIHERRSGRQVTAGERGRKGSELHLGFTLSMFVDLGLLSFLQVRGSGPWIEMCHRKSYTNTTSYFPFSYRVTKIRKWLNTDPVLNTFANKNSAYKPSERHWSNFHDINVRLFLQGIFLVDVCIGSDCRPNSDMPGE